MTCRTQTGGGAAHRATLSGDFLIPGVPVKADVSMAAFSDGKTISMQVRANLLDRTILIPFDQAESFCSALTRAVCDAKAKRSPSR